MKLLAYADIQATDGDELCFTQPNTTLQHYRVAKLFKDIARIYDEHDCEGVIDLGDTTDDRSSIPLTTLEVLGAGIAELPDGEHWKLTGNHEQYLRDTSISNRRLFEHRFNVVDGTHIQPMSGWTAFFAAYPADHARLAEWLMRESRAHPGPKILFGHFQVEGAYFQTGRAIGGIPAQALKNFDLVLLGHIHLPQAVSAKIHYVGSPFQQDWGEIGQAKRVGVVNTKTMMVEWITLEGYPEYRQVTMAEFEKLAEEESEHRYRVTLNSHEESERFFRHPNFNRAVAQYNYDETPAQAVDENADWSFTGILRRYLKSVPPAKVGIEISDEEMLEVSDQIIRG